MIAQQAPPAYDRADQDRFRAAVSQSVNELEGRDTINYVSADRGDTSLTLNAGTDVRVQRFATALTGNRTITLGTGANGSEFRIVRTGLGAFTLDVGGLKTIPAGTAAYVLVGHDGTAWRLTGYGVL